MTGERRNSEAVEKARPLTERAYKGSHNAATRSFL